MTSDTKGYIFYCSINRVSGADNRLTTISEETIPIGIQDIISSSYTAKVVTQITSQEVVKKASEAEAGQEAIRSTEEVSKEAAIELALQFIERLKQKDVKSYKIQRITTRKTTFFGFEVGSK